jgi:hypothetical protein
MRADGPRGRLGAVVEVGRIRSAVDVAPRFGQEANRMLKNTNSLEVSTEFNLNKYADKESFALLRD